MISSTSVDLPDHRREVERACLKEGVFPIGMENLPARDADAIRVSLEMVDNADIYIGIFACRYGHRPEGHEISITEMEFNRAVERRIPVLVFLSHEEHSFPSEVINEDDDAKKKLAELKQRASRGRGRREFKSPQDLRAEVIHALSDLIQRGHISTLSPAAGGFFPFVCVRNLAGIYGMDDDPGAFSPSLREFEEKLVHRPALADRVQAALLEKRFACMLGKGASGKTTLALLLAFSETFGPEHSYYFDLAETDDQPDAAESYRAAMQTIAQQHGRDALVIVDNIHLAEGLAHKLHLGWRDAGQPVRLLLQGRFTQQGADRRGRQSPLDELKRTALVLEVMREDLAGVLQRLVRRSKGNFSVTAIPPAILDQWLKVFGGELIAFSSASRRKLPQIVRGDFQLTEADAANYIREEYLENPDPKRRIDSSERENLLAIASCADWELAVPAEALLYPPGSALGISMKRGLVWQSIHGRYGQFARYRLCHPGMGKLLQFAAKIGEANWLDQVCALAQRNPHFGSLLASRLATIQGDHAAAERVLTSAVSNPGAFELLIEHGMVALHTKFRQLTGLAVMSAGEVDQKLATCKNLIDAALATPLGDLASFLEYAPTPMPKVWLALTDALADGKHRQTLVDAALATPMHFLARFLQYAQTSMPKVWLALSDALADENHRQTLVDAALATPLGHLASFLQYAQTPLPKVWQALSDALADEKHRQTLVDAALATPLGHLASFLQYAQTPLPKVWQALSDALADE
ncbi:MAG: DUF4062 domain-containing protein, partial [Verrucomicrobiaceae bacterium]|nr:DUF4062 domain-containing protein [Verrucomicrobiaceae bacterium]